MTNPHQRFLDDCAREIAAQGSDAQLQALTRSWFNAANANKYSYHFSWLGRPIIQYPQDIVAFQELVWQVRPDVIVETGIAHGGSLILSASLLAMLDLCEAVEKGKLLDPRKPKRKVIGIDIDIREHNREAITAHPMAQRITMLQGSSVDQVIIERVRSAVADAETVLVALDSNHTHAHVLAELYAYAPMVTQNSYCVVFDTVIEDLADDMFADRPWSRGNNAKTAVHEFLKSTNNFQIDKTIENKLLITVAPDGFLKRIS
jgi:cephalosporin hydroxylase